MRTLLVAAVCGLCMCVGLAGFAVAATRVEKKLLQVGGPETRSRCIKELKTKGVPKCKTEKKWPFKTTCTDTWIITCTEWATDFKQHEFFLVASGPDAPDALRVVLRNAIDKAFAAAIGVAAATPGEVGARVTAAVAAFKTTLGVELAAEPALASMRDKFNLSLTQNSKW